MLLAVPLFVYMGIMLEKSGLAESLLETMALLFGRLRGGLAISVVIVGAMLAASTGIVGATVITMGMISLPTMLKRGYSPEIATGIIASSGTLDQIIPPSVILVLLGSVLNVSVGDLFTAAIIPGFALVAIYLLYIIVYSIIYPNKAPSMPQHLIDDFRKKGMTGRIVKAFLLPFLLILAVLGSIFAGIASPTEAAGVGALGAILLTILQGKFNKPCPSGGDVGNDVPHLHCIYYPDWYYGIFISFQRAGWRSIPYRADSGCESIPISIPNRGDARGIHCRFFIDFIEIIFIFVPVVAPIFSALDIDLIWIGILLAPNLQTSFLTPPFGFSLFYLKGVAPPEIKTIQIYMGIIPFVIIQLIFLGLVMYFPEIVSYLPALMKK